MMRYFWDFGNFGGFYWIGMSIMMIITWVLLIVGIIWLVRYLGGALPNTPRDGSRKKTPLEILKERYAKGEIDKEEFDQKKKDLG